jgi:hypothetical protein
MKQNEKKFESEEVLPLKRSYDFSNETTKNDFRNRMLDIQNRIDNPQLEVIPHVSLPPDTSNSSKDDSEVESP